ncbi:MAG TPA: histidine kinase dimerization/phosphoacceptor domain -containing protein [Allosphingosinicella sp.]|jgi:two-component sensor histidine kinase
MSRSAEPLTGEDLLITPDLYRRPARDASLERELEAYRELSALMTVDPQLAIQRFLDLALELCPAAGSAGLSELSTDEDGNVIFRWTAMSGDFASHVGGTTPRDFSPCGLCLDHHHSILIDRPGRLFDYFNAVEPGIAEGLIVPLFDTGKRPLGTLWVVSHRAGDGFDATDARVMEQLAVQLVLAIKLRRKAKVLVQLEQVVRDKDVLAKEVQHRVKNTLQMTSALLHLQERGAGSADVRAALKEAQSRLLVLAKVYEALLQPEGDAGLDKVDVTAVIQTLMIALKEGAPRSGRIRLRAECDPLMLEASEAVPVGLVVNEAVTNALKHGFPGRRSGEVVVALRSSGDDCRLEIRDNGRGFERAVRDGSLGMRLIHSLARQLGAQLTVDGTNGGRIALSWRLSGRAGARRQREASEA